MCALNKRCSGGGGKVAWRRWVGNGSNIYGPSMNRRATSIVIAFVLTSALFATVATSGGVGLWSEPQWEPTQQIQEPVDSDASSSSDELPVEPNTGGRDPLELPDWLEAIFRVVLLAAVIGLLIALAMAAWRRRPRLRWRRRAVGEDFEVLPDVAAAIVDEAAAQRTVLRSGTPRNAIVQCWLRLEHDVANVGLKRNPADTSVEFTERVLSRYTVDSAAIHELSALYREARFSEHALDESARVAALDALERLHQALADSLKAEADPVIGAST